MKTIHLLLLIAFFAISSPTEALTIADYKSILKNQPDIAEIYITGVSEGVSWANVTNEFKNVSPIYCQPSNLALNAKNIQRIISDELSRNTDIYKDETPIEIVLIRGLEKTFPCAASNIEN